MYNNLTGAWNGTLLTTVTGHTGTQPASLEASLVIETQGSYEKYGLLIGSGFWDQDTKQWRQSLTDEGQLVSAISGRFSFAGSQSWIPITGMVDDTGVIQFSYFPSGSYFMGQLKIIGQHLNLSAKGNDYFGDQVNPATLALQKEGLYINPGSHISSHNIFQL
jgi:hypothetical protein